MEGTRQIIEIIEDHAMMADILNSICCALKNGTSMPNYIPVMNDGVITDQLGKICEALTQLQMIKQ